MRKIGSVVCFIVFALSATAQNDSIGNWLKTKSDSLTYIDYTKKKNYTSGKVPKVIVDSLPGNVQSTRIITTHKPTTSTFSKISNAPKNTANCTDHVGNIAFNMVLIKGGSFDMGSSEQADEKPVHKVTITDFYLADTEVTNTQFANFLNVYGSSIVKSGVNQGKVMIEEFGWGVKKVGAKWEPQFGYEQHPVIYVSWYGANEYCKWLADKSGKKYVLPSEAQWEYAAGGGASNRTKWAGTNYEQYLEKVMVFADNSKLFGDTHRAYGTHAVGTLKQNTLGIYDMSGNVYEWCSDWYHRKYYAKSNGVTNPVNDSATDAYNLRGGSWYNTAFYCRAAYRSGDLPDDRNITIGFRVARIP